MSDVKLLPPSPPRRRGRLHLLLASLVAAGLVFAGWGLRPRLDVALVEAAEASAAAANAVEVTVRVPLYDPRQPSTGARPGDIVRLEAAVSGDGQTRQLGLTLPDGLDPYDDAARLIEADGEPRPEDVAVSELLGTAATAGNQVTFDEPLVVALDLRLDTDAEVDTTLPIVFNVDDVDYTASVQVIPKDQDLETLPDDITSLSSGFYSNPETPPTDQPALNRRNNYLTGDTNRTTGIAAPWPLWVRPTADSPWVRNGHVYPGDRFTAVLLLINQAQPSPQDPIGPTAARNAQAFMFVPDGTWTSTQLVGAVTADNDPDRGLASAVTLNAEEPVGLQIDSVDPSVSSHRVIRASALWADALLDTTADPIGRSAVELEVDAPDDPTTYMPAGHWWEMLVEVSVMAAGSDEDATVD